jgi:hypothetical protein
MLDIACEGQEVRSQLTGFGEDAKCLSLITDITIAAAAYQQLQSLAENAVNAVIAAVRIASGHPHDTAWTDAYQSVQTFLAVIDLERLDPRGAAAWRSCRAFLAENADLMRP